MEELLASSLPKTLKLSRGQQIEGEIVIRNPKELILELGVKSEGVLPSRDIPKDQLEELKVGDKIKAYFIGEDESGQINLSLQPNFPTLQKIRGVNWARFQKAIMQKSKLSGKVLEINKGGLIVDVEGTRGFLPNSQVGFDLLSNLKQGLETLVGQPINVTVSDINISDNRLIFSQRGQISIQILEKLKGFKGDQQVTGTVVAILPFGLVMDLDGIEGLVFISDVSWEKTEDLSSKFKVGEKLQAQVLNIDEDLGRVNLSLKHLTEDPFLKIAQNFKADEVIKGEVTAVTQVGVNVNIEGGIDGILPASKMGSEVNYEVGKSMSFLVDTVDVQRRRINLAPFVTSTEGLIYK